MNAVEVWECGECGTMHTCDDAAAYCCRTPAHYWQCAECKDVHEVKAEATSCCADPDAPVIVPAAELESAGQERLF